MNLREAVPAPPDLSCGCETNLVKGSGISTLLEQVCKQWISMTYISDNGQFNGSIYEELSCLMSKV
ncbi:unnamed protein product [Caretta caretta]